MASRNTKNRKPVKRTNRGSAPGQDKTILGIRDISNFGNATLTPELSGVLAQAGIIVRFEIQAGGLLGQLVDQRTGTIIGGIEDLSQLAGLGSFVTQERRAIASEDSNDELGAIVLELENEILAVSPDWKRPEIIPTDFMTYLKGESKKVAFLVENFEKISELRADSSEEKLSKSILVKGIENTIEAIFDVLKTYLKEGKLTKGLLKEEIFKRGVPAALANKLSANLIVPKDGDINRILFPTAAKSWVTLTVKEVREMKKDLIQDLLTIANKPLTTFLMDDSFIRAFCHLDDKTNLRDESVPAVASLLNTKVHLIPHCASVDYIFEPMSKNKDQGLGLRPKFDTPSNSIDSLWQGIVRVATGMALQSDTLSGFWSVLYPHISIPRSEITKGNNIYKIFLSKCTDADRAHYLDSVLNPNSEEKLELYLKLLSENLLASDRTDQGIALIDRKALLKKALATKYSWPNLSARISTSCTNVRSRLERLKNESSIHKAQISELVRRFPGKKAREKDQQRQAAITVLGREAKKTLKDEISRLPNGKALKLRLEPYFTAFRSARMQDLAASILRTRISEFIRIEFDNSDDSSSSDGGTSSDEDGD